MFKTPYSYYQTELAFEYPDTKSMTVQGDSYTVRELMLKAATGNMPPIVKQGQYQDEVTFDSEDLNQMNNLSPIEKIQIMATNKEKIQQLTELNQQHRQQKAKQDEQKRLDAEAQKAKADGSPNL